MASSPGQLPAKADTQRRSGEVLPLRVAEADDAHLVAGLMAREPWAVSALFDRYDGVVRRMLVRTLGSTVDLDDLTQDTFITVVTRCHTLRDLSALRSFVVSVAIRIARNELRRRAVRRFVGLAAAAAELPTLPPHDATAAQGLRHLYAALDRLEPSWRIAFVLRHVEGHGLAEVAALCNCSLATVKRWLARAEQRLEALATRDPVLRELLSGRTP